MATSKNPSVVNTIYIYTYIYISLHTYVYTLYTIKSRYTVGFIFWRKNTSICNVLNLLLFFFFSIKLVFRHILHRARCNGPIFGEGYILVQGLAYIRDVNCITYLGVYIRGGTYPWEAYERSFTVHKYHVIKELPITCLTV